MFKFLFILVFSISLNAKAGIDGEILSIKVYKPSSYLGLGLSNLISLSPNKYTACVEWITNQKEAEINRIEYRSDGLKIQGIFAKPKNTSNISSDKFPVVIFNRGGNGEFGKVHACMIQYLFKPLIDRGFAVFASQYREADGSEGWDEFGGSDVHDVLNIILAARSLPWVDSKNIFMFGWSRGGMMTYLALKEKAAVNSAVVVAGESDLFLTEELNPIHSFFVHRRRIPDYSKQRDNELKKRSAIYWADQINVPLLIFQGDQDESVSIKQALKMDDALKIVGKKHSLIIYPGCDHRLRPFRDDLYRKTLDWFKFSFNK